MVWSLLTWLFRSCICNLSSEKTWQTRSLSCSMEMAAVMKSIDQEYIALKNTYTIIHFVIGHGTSDWQISPASTNKSRVCCQRSRVGGCDTCDILRIGVKRGQSSKPKLLLLHDEVSQKLRVFLLWFGHVQIQAWWITRIHINTWSRDENGIFKNEKLGQKSIWERRLVSIVNFQP